MLHEEKKNTMTKYFGPMKISFNIKRNPFSFQTNKFLPEIIKLIFKNLKRVFLPPLF